MRHVAFIDLEASGLGSASFPTELGWATISDDGSVVSGSCLIKPPSNWTLYANAWSPAAERLTGITREMLDREGLPPRAAMARFFAAVGHRDLFSDAPDFDSHWLGMLSDAAGISLDGRRLGDARKLIEEAGAKAGSKEQPPGPRHRAEVDARRLAAAYLEALNQRGLPAKKPVGQGGLRQARRSGQGAPRAGKRELRHQGRLGRFALSASLKNGSCDQMRNQTLDLVGGNISGRFTIPGKGADANDVLRRECDPERRHRAAAIHGDRDGRAVMQQ